jgi:hypothetical protein
MLKPFFVVAMQAPGRQATFRRVVVGHVLVTGLLAVLVAQARSAETLTVAGYALLCLGLVEGAALVGWRLTQLPKSLALEFLLTSPVQPRRLFFAEALVGVTRFALVQLSGLPVLGGLHFTGLVAPHDLAPLFVLPLVWGLLAGLCLTAWIYEPRGVQRVGEWVGLLGILTYLVVGVIAAENLVLWLHALPPALGELLYDGVRFGLDVNPFGVLRYWFTPDRVERFAWQRFGGIAAFAVLAALAAGARAACRLRGHFHDRHYGAIDSSRPSQLEFIGDQPLSWWAVRRVMVYSGKINLWLAGGFSLVYAAYLLAGDAWPPWMGRLVFDLFEKWGGAPAVATAMVILAGVPAAFQYGLWDTTAQDRCRRLELLLLTDLTAHDYWHAALAASWKRGRGYALSAAVLWFALGVSGKAGVAETVASVAGGVVLWCFFFAVGFRGFSTGNQTSGLASLLVLGTPLLLAVCLRTGHAAAANLVPAGLVYLPLDAGLRPAWFASYFLYTAATVGLTRYGLAHCDGSLRRWYDRNQGLKTAG